MEYKKNLRHMVPFFAANGLLYGLNALYYTFIPLYLQPLHSQTKVGYLLSVGPLVSILALLFWGVVSDKAKYRNNVLAFLVAASAICYVSLSFNSSFTYLLVVMAALMFFMSTFPGLIDSMTMEYASLSGASYGPIRIMGTVFFGVLSVALTPFTQKDIRIIFPIFIVMALLSVLSVKLMPNMKGYAHNTGKLSFKPFFRDKKLMTMLVYMIVIQFSVGYMFNFVGVYVTSDLGYDQWVWGAITFFSIIGEYAFFFVYDKIFKRFGTEKLLVFSAAMLVLRFLCVGLFKSPVILILSSILFGSFMTVLNYCATSYVNRTAPDELRASGQTFMYALGLSFPRFLSGALGGIMTDSFGVPVSLFIISGIIALLTITSPLQPLWDKKGINAEGIPDKL